MPKLKHFNEAICDHYCPEYSHLGYAATEGWPGLRAFIHFVKQKKDFKKAFTYTEEKLLRFMQTPILRERITGKHIEEWLKQIHKRAAKTILRDYGVQSGEYSQEAVIRWEKKLDFATQFERIVNTLQGRDRSIALLNLFNSVGLSEACQKTWINICCIVEYEKLTPAKDKALGDNSFHCRLLSLVGHARKHNTMPQFNDDIDEVLKFIWPEQVKVFMQTYCDQLAVKINMCDGSESAVIKLAAEAFRDLTCIHPFPNANGRVSTILLNLILVGFGLPSVVVRTIQDRMDDTESTEYHKVVKNLNTDLEPFIAYLTKKIAQEKHSPTPGTDLSIPAIQGDTILKDDLYALAKECHKKLKAVDGKRFNDPSNQNILHQNKEITFYLKEKSYAVGRPFGKDYMVFPGLLQYSDEEKTFASHLGYKLP